jgi:penicillin-binding protein-related factor A (putative recombinase)
MNVGKSFEKDIQDSINNMDNVFIRRLRDVQFYAGSVSIADYSCYKKPNLFLFELKTSKGISISISEKYKTHNKTKSGHKKGDCKLDDNGNKIISHYGRLNKDQLDMMIEASKVDGVHVGFVMEFRNANKCFYVSLTKVLEFINDDTRERKSIPVSFLDDKGLLLPRVKKSSVWDAEEQELILDFVGNGCTGKEVVGKLKGKLPDRNDASVKSKFYKIRKTKEIKPVTQYIHYEYDSSILDMIVGYEKSLK